MTDNTLSYDRQKFGKTVRTFRGAISGEDFARQLGTSRAELARIERGSQVEERLIVKLCKMMKVEITDFPAGNLGKSKDTAD